MAEVHPIVEKALKCIDEIYPSENALNEGYFPTDAFIDEAVRWVIDIVPTHELTERTELTLADATADEEDGDATADEEGMGTATVSDVGRIVYFKRKNWKRPVFGVITENDPRYMQQRNKVLRGNASRPIVALVKGRTKLEWWPADSADESESYTAKHVPYAIDSIPASLYDITAWKLAEIVLMSMHDTQGASTCTSKVNEHLEILAL